MKRLLNNVTPCVIAISILGACSGDGTSTDAQSSPPAGTPSAGGPAAAPTTTAGTSAAGAAGSPRVPAGVPSGVAGTRAGAATAGTPGTSAATAGTAGVANTASAGSAGTATAGAVAAAGAGGAAGAMGAPTSSRPLSSSLNLATKMDTPGVAPFFHVWRPTDIAAVEGKLPVMAWNNGACSRNDQVFKPLFDKWSAGGWIVLSLTSGGGSSSTSIADQKGLIDWIVAEADKAGSEYNGKVDLDRIVAGGNSCGGITSLGLAAQDERVAGIFVLSGSSGMGGANTMVTSKITVPVAYIIGGEEDIARANAEADYEAFADGIPSMIVSRSTGDHLMISNNADVMKDAADISINWMDLTMYGQQAALDALKQPTVCAGCMSGLWSMMGKNLETLVK
jgi:hypothetical protein